MTSTQEYLQILNRRCRNIRNALFILLGIEIALVVTFSVLGVVDSWVWFCAGLLPAIALWFIASLVLLTIYVINLNKRNILSYPSEKHPIKKFNDNTRVLFITLTSIMVMVIISIVIHLLLIEERRYRTGPATNVALFSTLIGIAVIVAYVYFFSVFIQIAKISKKYEELENKGVIAAWIFLSGLIVLLFAGIMDTAVDIYWIFEYDAFFLTKRILTIISLIIISVGSYYLDVTINIVHEKGHLKKRRNISFLLTISNILLPIIILIEMILRPLLYNKYYPSCPEDYLYGCARYLATETTWFSWIVFGALTLCLCVYFYSFYLSSLDYKHLLTRLPDEELVHKPGQIVQKPAVPGVGYPVRIMKPFMVRYDTNVKFSVYSILACIILGVVVCITFLADPRFFGWFRTVGSIFLVVMVGAIVVFHIYFTKFGIQIRQITSYDKNTEQLGSNYYTYTTFGIFFLYLGFFVNIMFNPRITSVFVISRAILVGCLSIITIGFYNFYKILEQFQAKGLLKKDQPIYKLLPFSIFALTALLIVETVIRKIIQNIYFNIQCTDSYNYACDRFYREKAAWLGWIDLVFFTLLLLTFLYSLYIVTKDIRPITAQISQERKTDEFLVVRPKVEYVAPIAEYRKEAKPFDEIIEDVTPQIEGVVICINCGEQIPKKSNFCEFCGATVSLGS